MSFHFQSRRHGVFVLIPFLISGCSSVSYLLQAGKGQLQLFNRARPLSEVMKDPLEDPALKELLSKVSLIKKFGEKNGLKPTSNYEEYVKLDRPSVVSVVTACYPDRFESKKFSFPIVGSFNYLGFFAESDAIQYARQLQNEGWEVDVRGAGAYSSLGWFRDPILSSMIPTRNGKIDSTALASLVNIVLHESVHATVYIKNQSSFNEGLATFLAGKMTDDWFHQASSDDQKNYEIYLDRGRKSEAAQQDLHGVFLALKQLYESDRPADEKQKAKEQILNPVRERYPHLRSGEFGINNATLIQFQTYHSDEAIWEALWNHQQGSAARFLDTVREVQETDFPRPQMEDYGQFLINRFNLKMTGAPALSN